jgi:predicted TPR repeat methyltransferase
MERHNLEWVLAAKSKEDIEKRYDEWASTYDRDLTKEWDYKLPVAIGDLFAKYVKDTEAKILEAGVGTGLGGEYMISKGYRNLFGIDMSLGMLKEAERKNIYAALDRAILGEPLGFPDNHFDAVLSVGTIGGAPPESFDEFIRVVKPSGSIVFSIMKDHYDKPRFHQRQQLLVDTGRWDLVGRTDPFLGYPRESPDTYQYGFVYKVL